MYSLSFHEKKRHGTLEFPAEYYYVDQSHPNYNMPFHWHKEWELIRILRGTFLIHADETEISAKAGDVLLIRDGMFHGGTPKDCIYECFVFDLHGLYRNLDTVKKYLRPIYRQQLLPQIHYPCDQKPEIAAVVSELMEAYSGSHTAQGMTAAKVSGTDASDIDASVTDVSDPHELITFGCISRLFALILQKGYYFPNEGTLSDSARRIDQVKSVMEYIENHYSSYVSLDMLAQVAGMNPKYFCRFFRSITHQTPMDYVNFYRIEQAASLLCATGLSVTRIGLECGFNDGSYFVKVFQKYRGITPNQYRKLNSTN